MLPDKTMQTFSDILCWTIYVHTIIYQTKSISINKSFESRSEKREYNSPQRKTWTHRELYLSKSVLRPEAFRRSRVLPLYYISSFSANRTSDLWRLHEHDTHAPIMHIFSFSCCTHCVRVLPQMFSAHAHARAHMCFAPRLWFIAPQVRFLFAQRIPSHNCAWRRRRRRLAWYQNARLRSS